MAYTNPPAGETETIYPPATDVVLPFQVGDHAVRGRLVRLGTAIDTILGRHPFEAAIMRLVGEAATVVSLLGTGLKFDGKLILQLQGDGPVSMVVADYHTHGALRATASLQDQPDPNVALNNANTPLNALLGSGHVAMTIDQGTSMERYQGVTPLDGETLEQSIVSYFQQSEQIPTALKLAVGKLSRPGEPDEWRAGGIIVQYVPGEGGTRERGEAVRLAQQDEEEWQRAEAFLSTTQADELLDPHLSSEQLLYRLFHEDGVRIFNNLPVRAECGCSEDKIVSVLSRYDTDSLQDMVEDGKIRVSCDFCRENYIFNPDGSPYQD